MALRKKEKKYAGLKAALIVLLCAEILMGGVVLAAIGYLNGITDKTVGITTAEPIFTDAPKPSMLNPDTNNPSATDEPDPTVGPGNNSIYYRAPKDKDILNIIIIGQDARPNEKRGRSDSTMILSYNYRTGKAKMISVLRDVCLPIEGHNWNRINAAYSFGGVGLTINTINRQFDMDIQKYLIVGFEGMVELIDVLGGITVPITQAEETYYSKMNGMENIKAGDNVFLNGAQALIHARNRHLAGTDFARTRRQRDIMLAIYKSVKQKIKTNPGSLITLLDKIRKIVQTNLTADELYSIASSVMNDGRLDIETAAVPFHNTYRDARLSWGALVLEIDIPQNKRLLNELIYGYYNG